MCGGERSPPPNKTYKNKVFFCGEFARDDIQLSEEHYEYGFFTLSEILKMIKHWLVFDDVNVIPATGKDKTTKSGTNI